jgi:type 1 fimbriae regulatory protein FimB
MIHLEPTEVLAVLKATKGKGAREWAMVLLAYKHGLRVSEVCNLRLDDIDMKNGNIVIPRLKSSLRTTQAVTEHRGEPLLNELKAPQEWLRQRRDDGSDYLFTSQKGGRLGSNSNFQAISVGCLRGWVASKKQHSHVLKDPNVGHRGFRQRGPRTGKTIAR